jgi:hypothetical protein
MAKKKEEKEEKEETKKGEMQDISVFLSKSNMQNWEKQALKVFTGWKPGKSVTEHEFNKAVKELRVKRLGKRRNETQVA